MAEQVENDPTTCPTCRRADQCLWCAKHRTGLSPLVAARIAADVAAPCTAADVIAALNEAAPECGECDTQTEHIGSLAHAAGDPRWADVDALIADAVERGYVKGYEEGLMDPGSEWMKGRRKESPISERRFSLLVRGEKRWTVSEVLIVAELLGLDMSSPFARPQVIHASSNSIHLTTRVPDTALCDCLTPRDTPTDDAQGGRA